MKTNTPRIAIRVFTLAALVVLASSPSTRTIAGPKLTKPASSAEPTQARLAESYGKLPLSFEANRGQTDPRVKFLSRGSGYTLFLTSDEAVLALRSQEPAVRSPKSDAALSEAKGVRSQKSEGRPWSLVPSHLQRTRGSAPGTKDKGPGTNDVLRMKLVGANQAANVTALDELSGKTNYFIGNDPKTWRTDVPTYGKVKYAGVYPGIDLVYYGNQRQLEYDFVVAPGADPKAVQLAVVGAGLAPPDGMQGARAQQAAPLRIDASGDLVVQAEGGEVRFHKPVVYQPTADAANPKSKIQNRKLLDGRYALTADNQIHFDVSGYDKTKPLVIDPVLVYSTYFGSGDVFFATGIAVDVQGNAYVSGYGGSIPTTPGAFQTAGSTNSAFVTKFNTSGSALVYSTFISGSADCQATAIAVDSGGNAYVTGIASAGFPTVNAFQPTPANSSGNPFVAKLNAAGDALIYSTYLGGSGSDGATAIAIDSSGNAYVTGETCSSDFPTTAGAFQTRKGGSACGTVALTNAFVTKLNPAGSAIVYSTYLGGSYIDVGFGVAVDSSGDAYVTGSARSNDFPTTSGAFQPTWAGGGAGFVSKLNPTGSALVYSTYLGGSASACSGCIDYGTAIAVDSSGSAYVTGIVEENHFPVTPGAFQTSQGSFGAFVTKLNGMGSALVYSGILLDAGTQGPGNTIAVDSSGNAYVTGGTGSDSFSVTSGALQPGKATPPPGCGYITENAFVAEVNAAGSGLVYASYLGGDQSDGAKAIAVDAGGNAYVAGVTNSDNFPVTAGAYQTTFEPQSQIACQGPAQFQDLFLTKMVLQTVGLSRGSVTFPNQPISTTSAAQTIVLSNSGKTTLSISSIAITGIDSGDFAETNNCGSSLAPNAACAINVTFTPPTNGTRSATLEVIDDAGNSPQTTSLTGTGIVPPGAASLAPTSLTFGNQAVSTTSTPQGITLSNNGAGAVTISSIVLSGANAGDFAQTNNCPLSPSTLAGNASCAISVTFSPTATGTRTATLVVSDNATNSPQTASLAGTGASSTGGGSGLAVVQVENNIDTLTIATSFSVPITTQRGNLLVAFARESSNGTDKFTVTDSAGQAWTLTSSGYKNTGSTGPRTGMFYVANSAAVTSVTVRYTTSGGVAKPGIMVMEISGAATSGVADGSVNNGSGALVGTSTSGSLATTNANDILIFATDTAADQKYWWTPGTGYTIPNNQLRIGDSGSNVRMAMQYALVSSNQNATTAMNYSNAAWNGNIFAAFKAGSSTGGSPAASLSPNSLTFANQTVETTGAAQAVTLSNTGTAALNISSIAVTGTNSGDFGQTNNCGTSVAAGAQCTINVTFTPTASGTRTAALDITDNESGSPQAASLTGTGEAAGGSGPAFVQVQNNIDVSGAAFTTFSVPITTNPGDLLVAFVRESSNGADKFTVTDSAGQTWALTASGYKNESGTGPRVGMFYLANSAALTSVTAHFTTSGGAIKPGIMVMEISGAAATAVADGSVNGGTAALTTASTSGGLLTSNASDLLIFATDASGNESGWTAGSGYAIPNNKLMIGASGSNVRMAMQYAVVNSVQTYTTGMTYTNSNWNGNILAAFK